MPRAAPSWGQQAVSKAVKAKLRPGGDGQKNKVVDLASPDESERDTAVTEESVSKPKHFLTCSSNVRSTRASESEASTQALHNNILHNISDKTEEATCTTTEDLLNKPAANATDKPVQNQEHFKVRNESYSKASSRKRQRKPTVAKEGSELSSSKFQCPLSQWDFTLAAELYLQFQTYGCEKTRYDGNPSITMATNGCKNGDSCRQAQGNQVAGSSSSRNPVSPPNTTSERLNSAESNHLCFSSTDNFSGPAAMFGSKPGSEVKEFGSSHTSSSRRRQRRTISDVF